jgi:hypothetical protein
MATATKPAVWAIQRSNLVCPSLLVVSRQPEHARLDAIFSTVLCLGDTNVDIEASVAPRNAGRGHRWRVFAVVTGHCAS